MKIIDGKAVARKIVERLKKMPKPDKKLVAFLVGDSDASASFLKQKKKIADELGIEFELRRFPNSISEAELSVEIAHAGQDDSVGGIIIQLPLPKEMNREAVLARLVREKDVDALSLDSEVEPLAVGVVRSVLEDVGWQMEDRVVGVVGRGLLIGQPIAEVFLGKVKDLIIFHSKTDLDRLKECDLVIGGAGKPGLIKPEMLKKGVGFIDFGFGMKNGKVSGDLDVSSLELETSNLELSFYTPTPGGTGPILVASLFSNFYKLNGSN